MELNIKRVVIIFALLITVNIITSQEPNAIKNDLFQFSEISNEVLLKELKEFQLANIDYAKGVERALFINIDRKENFKKYFITYVFDYYDLEIMGPISQVATFDNHLVFISVKDNCDFKLKKEFFLKIAALKFPETYEYYKKNESHWPLTTLYHEIPIWYLTFQNGKLMNRQIDKE